MSENILIKKESVARLKCATSINFRALIKSEKPDQFGLCYFQVLFSKELSPMYRAKSFVDLANNAKKGAFDDTVREMLNHALENFACKNFLTRVLSNDNEEDSYCTVWYNMFVQKYTDGKKMTKKERVGTIIRELSGENEKERTKLYDLILPYCSVHDLGTAFDEKKYHAAFFKNLETEKKTTPTANIIPALDMGIVKQTILFLITNRDKATHTLFAKQVKFSGIQCLLVNPSGKGKTVRYVTAEQAIVEGLDVSLF